MEERRIRELVRKVVHRTVGLTKRESRRRLVTEKDVRDLPFASELQIPSGSLITPLARQVAMDRHVEFVEQSSTGLASSRSEGINRSASSGMRVALGADHGGFALKASLREMLDGKGYDVVDVGTNGPESVDYPDFALAVASLVSQGQVEWGIMIDGAGIGSCMVANKIPGVRASMCYDQATARNSREHNNANLLTLGAGLIGENLAEQIVDTWLTTEFAAGRHARRVNKIAAIEKRFSRPS